MRATIALLILWLLTIACTPGDHVAPIVRGDRQAVVHRWAVMPIVYIDTVIVTTEGDSVPVQEYNVKYINPCDSPQLWPEGTANGYSVVSFGADEECIAILRLPQAAIDSLATKTDVLLFPENISATIAPAALANVRARLEERGIPANWVDNTWTWRKLIKYVIGVGLVKQDFEISGVREGRLRQSLKGVGLNTQYKDLPQQAKNTLLDMSRKYDVSKVKNTWTVRAIIKEMVKQRGNERYRMLDQTLDYD